MLKSTKLTKFRAPKMAKIAFLELLQSPELVSRRIWMRKILNFPHREFWQYKLDFTEFSQHLCLQVTVKISLYNTNLNVELQWSCILLIPRKKRPPCQCLGYLGIQVWRITRNSTITHQRNPKIADRHQWSIRMSMLTCKMVLNPEDQLRQGVMIQG